MLTLNLLDKSSSEICYKISVNTEKQANTHSAFYAKGVPKDEVYQR